MLKLRARTAIAGVVLAAVVAAGSGGMAFADDGPHDEWRDHDVDLEATLSGLNETGGGDPDGSGQAGVEVEGTEVCWEVSVRNIDGVTAAHIHAAAIGLAGPVVVDFRGQLHGCATVTPVLAAALAADPQGYYVNVHNPAFPAGAVRGQLRDDERGHDEGDEVELRTRLAGAAEVPNLGDPDGSGHFKAELEGTLICWKFREEQVERITARHIHFGAVGVAGPVVIGFGSVREGCRDVVAAAAAAIAANQSAYYVNVHNATYPSGALRGQLG